MRRDEKVRDYYRRFDEWRRLARNAYRALEYDTTLRSLGQHLPARGRVLDAGGGPGRYTIELARQGYDVDLVDLSPAQLHVARREIRRAGVERRVRGIHLGSVESLPGFGDRTFDGVVCLGGVLGHVGGRNARLRTLRELARIAKPGAPVAVSVMSRYSQFLDDTGRWPRRLGAEPGFYRAALRTGDYDGSHGFAPCHFFLPEELEAEMRASRLRVVERVGLEGLASFHAREVIRAARTDPAAWAAWKELHERTCTRPEVVATSSHFLMIGERR